MVENIYLVEKLAVIIVAVPAEQKMLTHARDLLVLFRVIFFCPNMAFCSISKVLYKGYDREKQKFTCDNLRAAYSSGVDG